MKSRQGDSPSNSNSWKEKLEALVDSQDHISFILILWRGKVKAYFQSMKDERLSLLEWNEWANEGGRGYFIYKEPVLPLIS